MTNQPGCRICLSDIDMKTEKDEIISPCGCIGTRAFVHIECFNEHAVNRCEICGFKYIVSQPAFTSRNEMHRENFRMAEVRDEDVPEFDVPEFDVPITTLKELIIKISEMCYYRAGFSILFAFITMSAFTAFVAVCIPFIMVWKCPRAFKVITVVAATSSLLVLYHFQLIGGFIT